MKTFLLSLSFACMAAGAAMAQEQSAEPIAATQEQISANAPGQMKLGVGIVYGTQAGFEENGSAKGGAGLNIGGEYFITDKLSAAPSFTYFFNTKYEYYGMEFTAGYRALNLDARYYLADNNGMQFYALGGIAVGFASVKVDTGEGKTSENESKAGINIGGGLTYPLQNNMELNAQLKYNTPMEQLAVQVGIAFPIN